MTAPFTSLELQQRIRWYVKVRWWYLAAIASSGIVSLIVRFGINNRQVVQDLWIAALALFINGLMFGATYWMPRWKRYFGALAVTQIVFDLILMTGAVFFNAGIETPIVMLFCIPILMSGAILDRVAIYTTGIAATGLFVATSLLDYANILKPRHIAAPILHTDPNHFLPALVIGAAILLTLTFIADFVGQLVRQRSQLAHQLEDINIEKAKIDAIIKTMGSALVAVDTKGDITLVNDNFEYLTGWQRDEVLGQPFAEILPMVNDAGEIVPPSERPAIQLSALGSKGAPRPRAINHYSYIRKDGTSFPFLSSLAPIVLNRKVVGITNTFDDVTDVQKLEQLKTNFVALVSHQLKTPIGEIQGYASNMLYGISGKLSKKQTEYVGNIRDVAERCSKLITDLLDITVLERGGLVLDIRPVRLSQAVRQLTQVYHDRLTKKGLALKIVKPSTELVVLADTDKLVEALGNVLANAIAYSKKGTITIESKAVGDTAEITISDEGNGMDRATLSVLFDKDTVLSAAPTAEGGTGLGLYLARQLVQLQKGTITVTKTTKKGTAICITVPLAKG